MDACVLALKALLDTRDATSSVTSKHHVELSAFQDGSHYPCMIRLPSGRFVMGSPVGEKGHSLSESPLHEVSVPSFAMGAYEVTFGEFRHFVEETDYAPDEAWRNPSYYGGIINDRHPVHSVTYQDANAYVKWLSHKTKRVYRLPSEAEWEYASRAGDSGAFSLRNYRKTKSTVTNSYSTSPPGLTGRYAPNAFGLYDTIGGVWEMVADCFHADYAGAPSDGSAWMTGCVDEKQHLIRGGSWYNNPQDLRYAKRLVVGDRMASPSRGFRVAASVLKK